MDAALAAVADDVRVTIHGLGVRANGIESIRQALADIVTAFPDLRVTTKRVLRTGDVVTAELKVEGTQAADYAGAINQEKHLDLRQAWRFDGPRRHDHGHQRLLVPAAAVPPPGASSGSTRSRSCEGDDA